MNAIANGTVETFSGIKRVFYDGYWIRHYQAPESTLEAKRRLIEALTRRLFNHVEHGINIPGKRLKAQGVGMTTMRELPARNKVPPSGVMVMRTAVPPGSAASGVTAPTAV